MPLSFEGYDAIVGRRQKLDDADAAMPRTCRRQSAARR